MPLAGYDRLAELLEALPVGALAVDSSGTIKLANETVHRTFGYSAGELVNRSVDDLVPSAIRPGHPAQRDSFFANPVRRVMGAGRDLVGITKTGDEVPVEVGLSPLSSKDGVARALVTVVDIRRRRELEEERRLFETQVQDSQRLESLGVLAGGIAHDFNNLLMSILGFADLALDDLPSSSPAGPKLGRVVSSAKQAADLCRQMLAYAGKGTVALQPVDLNRVVEDMTKLLEVTISKKALISYAFAKDLPNVMADLTQIGQVVLNLVGNAAEAIGEKSGAVTITTGLTHCDAAYLSVFTTEKLSEGLYVTLEVADTGCGMPEDVIARVCEPFFTTKFTGRGLGLAVVQGVVRKHNGAIRFYSELESGTTVKLIFPALEVTSDEVAPDDPSGWSGKGLVLLADDDEGARSVAAVMLERLGFSVIEACDGREAVSCFGERREEIALVLMDLMMPHMNGKEAYGEMRQADTEVPIVLCSGYNESELGARFAGRAVSAFLEKPYTLKILRATLSEILGDMN